MNKSIFFKTLSTVCVFFISLSLYASSFIGNRTDFRDETIYFVITTRFYDGDSGNNAHCWDGNNPGDPAWRGDFKGLIEKLDYIKALGFTAIWITPIVENASGYDYHGYHAMSFKKVDQRYESEDVSFKTLIDAVHAKGMKIILDIVLNHTGNFGEETLCPMFEKEGNLSSICSMQLHPNTKLPSNYFSLNSGQQYDARLARMKNTDGTNHDSNNYWHHFGNFNWDNLTAQWAQIAGDCVDLNTENPDVYNYLVKAYTQFIDMGVDGFRIDTGRHISRLVFNKVFNDAFHNAAKAKGKTDFFMFAEICTRVREIWNRGIPAISTPFYTWKDSKNYNWSSDAAPYKNVAIFEGNFNEKAQTLINQKSCIDNYNDNSSTGNQPSSNNHKLNGNAYRATDYSKHSGLNVIDFPMHWNFRSAGEAFGVAVGGDWAYNDATYNVVYVDSHDYAPDGAPEGQRFAQPQDVWAENLSLMFTFRGIPCLYYGSEIEFKKGKEIDKGPNLALKESGRAYFGGYITGNINVTDFAEYDNANGNIATTLKHPLALHIQRLNKIRMAVPALRKGQYSTDNVSGGLAFKRRYTDAQTDSYVLVAISGNATFNNIENGTYTDVITGDTKTVNNGSLTINVSGKGNLRAYVLSTTKTPAPGKIGTDGKYLYASSSVNVSQGNYDGKEEALTADPDKTGDNCGSGGTTDPEGHYLPNNIKINPENPTYNDVITLTMTSGWVTGKTLHWGKKSGESNWKDTPFVLKNGQYVAEIGPFDESYSVIKFCINTNGNDWDCGSGDYTIKLTAPTNDNPRGANITKTLKENASYTFTTADFGFSSPKGNTFKGIKILSLPASGSLKVNGSAATVNQTVSNVTQMVYTIGTQQASFTYKIVDNQDLISDATYTATFKIDTPEPAGIKIRLKKPANWSTVKVYAWQDGKPELIGKWPGAAATDEGNGWYAYLFDSTITNVHVIFNNDGNGQNQSENIQNITVSTCYEGNGYNGSNNLKIKEVACPTTSIEDGFTRLSMVVYPSPMQQQCLIRLPYSGEESHRLFVYDLSGKRVVSERFEGSEYLLQRNHLNSGMYILEVLSGNASQVYRAKLLVR